MVDLAAIWYQDEESLQAQWHSFRSGVAYPSTFRSALIMEIHKARPIGELLAEFIHGSALEQPLLERKVVALWPEVLGPTVAQFTSSIEVKNGVLYVRIRSAALKSQLFDIRHDLVRKLNDAAGAKVINDIRLLG